MPQQVRTSNSQEVSFIAARISLELFESQGYENTTVDEVARAVGMSRRTFFRYFGSKEDIIFTDHEYLLKDIETFLENNDNDPWQSVLTSAQHVFEHFVSFLNFAKKRFRVIRTVSELRSREMVMVVKYQNTYHNYLCSVLPEQQHLKALMFVSAMVSAHNQIFRAVLREQIRVDEGFQQLDDALNQAAQYFQIGKYAPHHDKDSAHYSDSDRLQAPTSCNSAVFPKITVNTETAMSHELAQQLRDIAEQLDRSWTPQ